MAAPWGSLWEGEFGKRFVVPAQFVLAFWTARVVAERLTADRTPASGPRDGVTARHNPPRAAIALLICCLCVSAVSGLSLIVTSGGRPEVVAHQRYGAPLKIRSDDVIDQRAAADIPILLRMLFRNDDSE